MLDEVADDDPLFARVRAARPNAPVALERDVIAKLARPSRRPVIVGAVVAIAAIACIVLLMRGGDDRHEIIDAGFAVITPVDAPAKPAAPDDAPPAPPKPRRADWTDVAALWDKLDTEHRSAIAACLPGKVSIVAPLVLRFVATKGGPVALDPKGRLPAGCRDAVLRAIQVPDLPMELVSIDFVMTFPPSGPSPQTEWKDPIATLKRVLDTQDLASCVYGSSLPMFVVDRTHQMNPRIAIPPNQFPEKDGAQVKCMEKLIAAMAMPPLPKFILSITARHQIRK